MTPPIHRARTMRRATLLSTTLIATLALAGPAEDTAKAREAFVAGQGLYSSGKYAEALKQFEASYALKPHPATVFNIARCLDRTNELIRAMTSYKEYLRLAPTATDADEVTKAIASIEQRLQAKGTQHVLVYTEPIAATVSIDGKEVGTTSPAATALAPGQHTVVITAPGYEPYERSFALGATRSLELTVSLSTAVTPPVGSTTKPADPKRSTTSSRGTTSAPKDAVSTTGVSATSSAEPRKRVFTWVAGGVAVAAAGASLGTFLAMGANEAQLASVIQSRTRETATRLYNDAFTFGTLSTVFAITAGVSAAVAVLLFFIEGR
ncbi:MAG: PEGA domain-containing protein [Myxococcaceae bacterium]|nr:PEGA domain-containing protein [Myxococcaceae bacterium]